MPGAPSAWPGAANRSSGSKTKFAADRELADRFIAVAPQTSVTALDNRAFLGRAVRYLVEQGIDQFLDIGTGITPARCCRPRPTAAEPSSFRRTFETRMRSCPHPKSAT